MWCADQLLLCVGMRGKCVPCSHMFVATCSFHNDCGVDNSALFPSSAEGADCQEVSSPETGPPWAQGRLTKLDTCLNPASKTTPLSSFQRVCLKGGGDSKQFTARGLPPHPPPSTHGKILAYVFSKCIVLLCQTYPQCAKTTQSRPAARWLADHELSGAFALPCQAAPPFPFPVALVRMASCACSQEPAGSLARFPCCRVPGLRAN